MTKSYEEAQNLTGRLQQGPDSLLHEEILQPQFTYEMQHLIAHYLRIEKAMLLEYHLKFRADRMMAACEEDYFGGFALANALTRQDGIPYRKAQTIVGAYFVAMMTGSSNSRRRVKRSKIR